MQVFHMRSLLNMCPVEDSSEECAENKKVWQEFECGEKPQG